jgi:hypothetical protein
MKRKHLSKKSSGKMFKKGNKTHVKNLNSNTSSRGGIRL